MPVGPTDNNRKPPGELIETRLLLLLLVKAPATVHVGLKYCPKIAPLGVKDINLLYSDSPHPEFE